MKPTPALITPNSSQETPTIEEQELPWFLIDSREQDHTFVRKVEVDPELGKNLKSYQRDGVEFLWRNCFSDFNYHETGDQSQIGGCILAHFMGLGKSLTTITVLHTVLADKKKRLLDTALLVAPANTLTNWVNEVEKWTDDLEADLPITNLGETLAVSRKKFIQRWKKKGGILLLSDVMFKKHVDYIVSQGQPDVLVLDEAHTMLKQSDNKVFKRLLDITTKRKILLTGTPLQNNLSEYFRLIEYARPGVVGVDSEADFEEKYRAPIELGLPSDALDEEKLCSMELLSELKTILDPCVDRKGPDVLRQLLPPIYDNLLYLQSSLIQAKLLSHEKESRENGKKSKNFLSYLSHVTPLLNHPGTLKLNGAKQRKKMSWKSELDVAEKWFMKAELTQQEFEELHKAHTSPKLVILAHILASALRKGYKVLIYSEKISTLDIIEFFLGEEDWKTHVESLESSFKEDQLGGWEKGRDYLRIDGSVQSSTRGALIQQFKQEQMKAFLVSARAGGIGINLCEANVVVIMDNHFNPTIASQCISRAHRWGQKLPVYVFRLAIENTVEEKIFARTVIKEGVALQVVDGKFSEASFSAAEVSDLQAYNNIMTCNECGKKRRLIDQDPPSDNCKWVCAMNSDKRHNQCHNREEEDLSKPRRGPTPVVDNPILEHVLGVINFDTRWTPLVSDYLPVQITDSTGLYCEDAIKRLKDEISGEPNPRKRKKIQ